MKSLQAKNNFNMYGDLKTKKDRMGGRGKISKIVKTIASKMKSKKNKSVDTDKND